MVSISVSGMESPSFLVTLLEFPSCNSGYLKVFFYPDVLERVRYLSVVGKALGSFTTMEKSEVEYHVVAHPKMKGGPVPLRTMDADGYGFCSVNAPFSSCLSPILCIGGDDIIVFVGAMAVIVLALAIYPLTNGVNADFIKGVKVFDYLSHRKLWEQGTWFVCMMLREGMVISKGSSYVEVFCCVSNANQMERTGFRSIVEADLGSLFEDWSLRNGCLALIYDGMSVRYGVVTQGFAHEFLLLVPDGSLPIQMEYLVLKIRVVLNTLYCKLSSGLEDDCSLEGYASRVAIMNAIETDLALIYARVISTWFSMFVGSQILMYVVPTGLGIYQFYNGCNDGFVRMMQPGLVCRFNLQGWSLFVGIPEIVFEGAEDWSCFIKALVKEVEEHTAKCVRVRMVLVWDVVVKQLPICTIAVGTGEQDGAQAHVIVNEFVLFAIIRLRMLSVKQFYLQIVSVSLLLSIVRWACCSTVGRWFRTSKKIEAGCKMVVVVDTKCVGLFFRIHNFLNETFIASEASIKMIEKPKGRCYGFFNMYSHDCFVFVQAWFVSGGTFQIGRLQPLPDAWICLDERIYFCEAHGNMGLDSGPEGHKTDGGRMKEEDSDAPLNTSMVFTTASSSPTRDEYGFGKNSTAGFKMDVNHGIAGLEMDVDCRSAAASLHGLSTTFYGLCETCA